MRIHVIGGGLAGCEAAWQVARAGVRCVLYEMRPIRVTPAHKTDRLAELVCSNSLKSEQENTAPWLLKRELRTIDSLLLRCADRARVPGGHALTVDRTVFADEISNAIERDPLIELRREEATRIPDDEITIIASGPLTSDALTEEIAQITGSDRLYFYDAISPIVDAHTVDMSIAFRASRYGKSIDNSDDYINCPFNREQYERFVDALLSAEAVPFHIDADKPCFFEACLPIEELARRGRETLRFGPMKPMGLTDPRTGRRPYAAVQLRQENVRADSYNLVGFQNHMRFGEQQRVFRMIPGLERAEFVNAGAIVQCRARGYLGARVEPARVESLAAQLMDPQSALRRAYAQHRRRIALPLPITIDEKKALSTLLTAKDDLDRAPPVFEIGGLAPLDFGGLRGPELVGIGEIAFIAKQVFDDLAVEGGKIEQRRAGRNRRAAEQQLRQQRRGMALREFAGADVPRHAADEQKRPDHGSRQPKRREGDDVEIRQANHRSRDLREWRIYRKALGRHPRKNRASRT